MREMLSKKTKKCRNR